MNAPMVGRFARFALCLSVVWAPGCDKKAKDEVAASQPVAISPAVATNGVRYVFSAPDSKIEFVGAKVTGKEEGSVGNFSGVIQVADANPEKASVTADIDMSSLQTHIPKLTEHLKSPDFFDAAKFPKARFVSTSVKSGGADGATHTVTGNLELHGVTKSISVPATIHVRPDGVDVDSKFSINRKDFGVVYPGKPDDLIRDDVGMVLAIRAHKE